MIILGAGMTGCLAAYAFKNAVIHEYLETPNTHSAVLRFRSEEISKLTNIPFKKVTVEKGIYHQGVFVNPNPQVINLYSKKVTGGYYARSINNIDSTVRYIAPNSFHQQMLDHLDNRIAFNCCVSIEDHKRPVISTLPLPVLCKMLGVSCDIPKAQDASPIYVTTADVTDCDLYQTIYYPGDETYVYRASVTGSQLIVESTKELKQGDLAYIVNSFGINPSEVSNASYNKVQNFGKFVPLQDDKRKDLMYNLTKDYGVYSLGRHATWRKVLLDDVNQDINRIKRMIEHSAYDLMVGKVK